MVVLTLLFKILAGVLFNVHICLGFLSLSELIRHLKLQICSKVEEKGICDTG